MSFPLMRSSLVKLASSCRSNPSALLTQLAECRSAVVSPSIINHASRAPMFARPLSTEAATSPFDVNRESTSSSSTSYNSDADQQVTTKSVDDFRAPNIFTNGVPFFSEAGMASFRVVPAMFKQTEKGNYTVEYAGILYLTFYPRSETELNKFDTSKVIRIRVRAVDIGSILEIDAKKVEKEVTIQGINGHLQVIPGDTEGTLKLKGIPKKRFEETPEFVEVEIATGQFKTLQTVLTHAAPTLFGWQVLSDPRLVPNFMDPRTLQYEENEKAKQEKNSFFDAA